MELSWSINLVPNLFRSVTEQRSAENMLSVLWTILVVALSRSSAHIVASYGPQTAVLPKSPISRTGLPLAQLPSKNKANVHTQRAKGIVVPSVRLPTFSGGRGDGDRKEAPVDQEVEEKELGIKDLLTKYGLIALGFHFTVWCLSVTVIYTLISTVGIDTSHFPESLGFLAQALNGEEGAESAAGFAGRASATLALVEVIGPPRLALTVAATPKVSEYARRFKAVQSAEAWVLQRWEALTDA